MSFQFLLKKKFLLYYLPREYILMICQKSFAYLRSSFVDMWSIAIIEGITFCVTSKPDCCTVQYRGLEKTSASCTFVHNLRASLDIVYIELEFVSSKPSPTYYKKHVKTLNIIT